MTNDEADSKGEGPTKPVTATLDLYEAIEKGALSFQLVTALVSQDRAEHLAQTASVCTVSAIARPRAAW